MKLNLDNIRVDIETSSCIPCSTKNQMDNVEEVKKLIEKELKDSIILFYQTFKHLPYCNSVFSVEVKKYNLETYYHLIKYYF